MITKKIAKILPLFVIIVGFSGDAFSKSKTYIYRHRANWVKLVKLRKKQLGGVALDHPYKISTSDMENMLLSIRISKSALFSKKSKIKDVFSIEEAKKYAPLLVTALRKAQPNQVVNFSIIHQRPNMILRNDYLSMVNLYVTSDGIHFNFRKLFAQMSGDYLQASNLDKSIRKAKGIRVSLEAGEGQRLAYDDEELIFDKNFDSSATAKRVAPETKKSRLKKTKKQKMAKIEKTNESSGNSDVMSRLKKLDELKDAGLISNTEYKEKKKDILNDL